MEIVFFSESIDFKISDEKNIRQWIFESIISEDKKTGEINVVFCSDDYLLEMNKQYLSHDYYTDVITFDYAEGKIISGDIFISIDRVGENAKKFGVSSGDELLRVIIHGIMHLCGYKDSTETEKNQMRKMENKYLKKTDYKH